MGLPSYGKKVEVNPNHEQLSLDFYVFQVFEVFQNAEQLSDTSIFIYSFMEIRKAFLGRRFAASVAKQNALPCLVVVGV